VRAIRPVSLGLLIVLVAALAASVAIVRDRGYRLYIVHTGSMMPALNPGDVVVDRPAVSLHAGAVITFRQSDTSTDVVTHRISAVRHGRIHTKGDANRTADVGTIRPDQVQGTLARRVPRLGYLLVFLKQPAGVGALMSGALAAAMLWGLFFPAGTSSRKLRTT